jgi:hypothetical protein
MLKRIRGVHKKNGVKISTKTQNFDFLNIEILKKKIEIYFFLISKFLLLNVSIEIFNMCLIRV